MSDTKKSSKIHDWIDPREIWDVKWEEKIKEKEDIIMEQWEKLKKSGIHPYEPYKYGTGFTITSSAITPTAIEASSDGKIKIQTHDLSTIVVDINNNLVEFDGIQITTEMLRNVTKKINEEEKEEYASHRT